MDLARIPGSPAAFYNFLMDMAGKFNDKFIWQHSISLRQIYQFCTGKTVAMQSCRVQSEGVKNESKGLHETGVPPRN